jgi:hypothetical protein
VSASFHPFSMDSHFSFSTFICLSSLVSDAIWTLVDWELTRPRGPKRTKTSEICVVADAVLGI